MLGAPPVFDSPLALGAPTISGASPEKQKVCGFMSSVLSAAISPHLPLLRRYARALCGAQDCGDAAVAATLEQLVADPARFDRDAEPREELFRLFSRYWNVAPVESQAFSSQLADRRLAAMAPASRQAFLLTALEHFSVAAAARVLERSEEDLRALLAQAGGEIAAQMTTRVAIIEDEPLIAFDLENLVESLGHRVVGMARTRAEAVSLARAARPGLVLADVRLADGSSGLDAVNDILQTLGAPVIFITAFPETLLTGRKPEPAFLISKPFRPETVKAAIAQALFFDERARPAQKWSA